MSLAIGLSVVAIIVAISVIIVGQMDAATMNLRQPLGESAQEAINATLGAVYTAFNTIGSFITIIAIVVLAVIIIGMVMTLWGGLGGGKTEKGGGGEF